MCETYLPLYKSIGPSMSLCDRLKQRYENYQQGWLSLFSEQFRENDIRDNQFIRYIVNYIIEQAKHNIVISELPDVIQTLHEETEVLIRENRMITLEEAIAQVQAAGAVKFPYLKKTKPVCNEDFTKEVMRQVFNHQGTLITLDIVENICRFISCSVKQLRKAMPGIDVEETAKLIIEDISRNQKQNGVNNEIEENRRLILSSSRNAISRKADKKSKKNKQSVENYIRNCHEKIYSNSNEFLYNPSVIDKKENFHNHQHRSNDISSANFMDDECALVPSHDELISMIKSKILNRRSNENRQSQANSNINSHRTNMLNTQTYSIESTEGVVIKTDN